MNKGEDMIVKNQTSIDEFNRKRQEKAEKHKERLERRALKNGV